MEIEEELIDLFADETSGIEAGEDGEIVVELGEVDLQTAPEYDYEVKYPYLKNLARDLSDEEQERVAALAIQEYENDDSSRSDWIEQQKEWLELFNGRSSRKKLYEWMSEDTIPILTEAVNQFYTRSSQHLFNSPSFIKCRPFGNITKADIQASKRVEKYLTYVLMIRNKKYKRDKKKLLKALPLYGTVFSKVYYDTVKREVTVENVSANDLIVSYGVGSRAIEEVVRKTHRYYLSSFRADQLVRNGYFITAPEREQSFDLDSKQQEAQDTDGFSSPADATMAEQHLILEQHRFLKLEGDEFEKPYIVWVCKHSGKLLRVASRWKVDKEGMPVDEYEPKEYFTEYSYSENPDGFYAHGMGHFVGQSNKSANRILQQCIDAGTLANIPTGFISKALGLPGGEIQMEFGKFPKIDAMADDIQKMLYVFRFPGPNQSLIQLMDAMVNRADRLAMVTEALTGTSEKVLQPTTILALIEQALQPYNAAMENIVDSLTRELQKVYECIGQHFEEEEYFTLLDLDGDLLNTEEGMMVQSVAATDFDLEMDVMPVADPKLATDQQRQAKAQAEYEFALNNPIIAQNPQALYVASRRFLEAMEVEDIDELLPPPQPPAPEPQGPAMPQMGPGGLPPEMMDMGGLPPEMMGGLDDGLTAPGMAPAGPIGPEALAGITGNPVDPMGGF